MKTRNRNINRSGLVVVLLTAVASPGMAQLATMQFPVARDNSIVGWNNHNGFGDPPEYDKFLQTEEFSNFGGAVQIRARKGNQHAVIMDWDTDAINAFIANNVDTSQPMQWTLNVFPVAGPPDDVPIETLESLNDWTEGDGPATFTNFNWDPNTTASTTNFAQTAMIEDEDGDYVLDLENSLPWIDNDTGTGGIDDNQYSILEVNDSFSLGNRVPDFINSEYLLADDLLDAEVDGTFASVPLDEDFVDAILNDPVNRGIVFGPISAFDNWQIYSRENDGIGGMLEEADRPGPLASFLELRYTPGGGQPSGDFNNDGILDIGDLDDLTGQAASGQNPPVYDLDGDGSVNETDVRVWVKDLFGSWVGDADLDGEFNSNDLVIMLAAGTYEADVDSVWSSGDFNGDGRTNSNDLVAGLGDGGYEQGPRAALVPEPSAVVLMWAGLIVYGLRRAGR